MKHIGWVVMRDGHAIRTGYQHHIGKVYEKIGSARGVAKGRTGVRIYPVYIVESEGEEWKPSAAPVPTN